MHRLLRPLELGALVDVGPRDGGVRSVWLTDEGRKRLALARRSVAVVERGIEEMPSETRIALVEALGAARVQLAPPPMVWWPDDG